MKKAKLLSLLLALAMLLSLAACGTAPAETPAATEAPAEATEAPAETPAESAEITVTDLIGREVAVTPGSYRRVVCIGAGALRLYSYIGDVSLLCGVEDIDNETLSERPKMFDSVARPYVLAHSDMFASLPSCGVGGPNAQSPEAEKILTCEPDIVISLYGDADKANALQEQLGVPVVTLMSGPDSVFTRDSTKASACSARSLQRARRQRRSSASSPPSAPRSKRVPPISPKRTSLPFISAVSATGARRTT